MYSFILDTAAASAENAQANTWQMAITLGVWLVVIVVAYFLFIFPQRKKQKQEEELRNNIEIGDDVTTIGGIVGRVIAVRDDDETIIVETGSDKTRMRFKKWAISSVDTPQPKKEDTQNPIKTPKKTRLRKMRNDYGKGCIEVVWIL